MKNIIEILSDRVNVHPDKTIIKFVQNKALEFSDLTYKDLFQSASVIAFNLLQISKPLDRVIILMNPGLEFIKAFYGCLMAGVIAIPLILPKKLDHTQKLKNLIKNADSKLILTNSDVLVELNILLSLFMPDLNIQCLSLDELDAGTTGIWNPSQIPAEQIAYLQYTSGSTQNPRAAKITHQNIMHSLEMLSDAKGFNEDDLSCSWLPHMHNMGLYDTTIYPVFSEITNIVMSPFQFLEAPHIWLELISKFKVTLSGANCGGYEHCISSIKPDQTDSLDLSSWRIAFVGGEMVRKDVLERFHQKFKRAGFDFNAFYPSYGLAETTIFVSSKSLEKPIKFIDLKQSENSFVKVAASVGSPSLKQEVIIVNPVTCQKLGENEIGEIWIMGPNVAGGYWNDMEKTEESFQAKLAEDPDLKTYLRTGDLGLFNDGELYIVGRQKELIIIRGVNHYPEDIEETVKNALPQFNGCSCAAFSLEMDNHEELGIICEVPEDNLDISLEEIIRTIISKIAENHDLSVKIVVLVRQKTLPKTVSGKIKRFESRDLYLKGEINILKEWRKGESLPALALEKDESHISDSILETIVASVAEESQLLPQQIDPSKNFNFYGIDSLSSMRILSKLQRTFSCDIPHEVLVNSASMKILAENIRQLPKEKFLVRKKEKFQNIHDIPEALYNFSLYQPWLEFQKRKIFIQEWGIDNPYFRIDEGVSNHLMHVNGRELINYSSYNYLSLTDHPLIKQHVKEALELYGTSPSSSRLFSQKKIHQECEQAIADFVGLEAALLFVQGHATNTTTLGHLFTEGDLIFCDSLDHNSIYQGALLSHAKVIPFLHNDWKDLEKLLKLHRLDYGKCVIVIEGAYSMEGDIPFLPEFIRLKKQYRTFLMLDEAHSLGVLGPTGKGIVEYYHANPKDVDILMGTLSKSLASCGGFIAGSRDLIDYLSYTAPGFVYSVAISPMLCAAALTALRIIESEPQRVQHLNEMGQYFRSVARSYGLNYGVSQHTAIVPIIIGDTEIAFKLVQRLFERGINVHPITYPVVPVGMDRLRFCITHDLTHEQIDYTLKVLHEELQNLHKS